MTGMLDEVCAILSKHKFKLQVWMTVYMEREQVDRHMDHINDI